MRPAVRRRGVAEGDEMPEQPKAVTFDVNEASLGSLREAFPDWVIEAIDGANARSLDRDWNPGAVDLLVVGARPDVAETLGLCRELRSQAGRARAPLLLLVPPGREGLVRAALEAGATSCLVLPVHPKDLAGMVNRAREGSSPGRHTLALDQPQQEDRWRDDGGEG